MKYPEQIDLGLAEDITYSWKMMLDAWSNNRADKLCGIQILNNTCPLNLITKAEAATYEARTR